MEIKVPFLGEGIDKVLVSSWHFKAGDYVHEGEDLVELSADKAIFDLPMPKSGTLRKILVKEGSEVSIGEILATTD